MRKKLNSNSFGLGLIGALLIIGALILTAGGVVVWERKVTPAPSPTPSATPTPRPTLIPSVSPKVPPPVDQTFKFCEKDKDCKIIFSGCICDATNINDPRKHLIIPGEPDCFTNDCITYNAKAVCVNNQCRVKLEIISKTSSPPTKIPPEVKACQKDEDCFLGVIKACLSICDPCITGDVSEPVWEALNKNWCQKIQKSIRDNLERKGFLCPACISGYTNKNNLQVKCIKNICTKTK